MIELLSLGQTGQAVITLAVVVGMFVLFMREAFPTEVVAILGVAVLLALGVLPYQAAVDVLANPAPWTIAAMFIVMRGFGAHWRFGGFYPFGRAACG